MDNDWVVLSDSGSSSDGGSSDDGSESGFAVVRSSRGNGDDRRAGVVSPDVVIGDCHDSEVSDAEENDDGDCFDLDLKLNLSIACDGGGEHGHRAESEIEATASSTDQEPPVCRGGYDDIDEGSEVEEYRWIDITPSPGCTESADDGEVEAQTSIGGTVKVCREPAGRSYDDIDTSDEDDVADAGTEACTCNGGELRAAVIRAAVEAVRVVDGRKYDDGDTSDDSDYDEEDDEEGCDSSEVESCSCTEECSCDDEDYTSCSDEEESNVSDENESSDSSDTEDSSETEESSSDDDMDTSYTTDSDSDMDTSSDTTGCDSDEDDDIDGSTAEESGCEEQDDTDSSTIDCDNGSDGIDSSDVEEDCHEDDEAKSSLLELMKDMHGCCYTCAAASRGFEQHRAIKISGVRKDSLNSVRRSYDDIDTSGDEESGPIGNAKPETSRAGERRPKPVARSYDDIDTDVEDGGQADGHNVDLDTTASDDDDVDETPTEPAVEQETMQHRLEGVRETFSNALAWAVLTTFEALGAALQGSNAARVLVAPAPGGITRRRVVAATRAGSRPGAGAHIQQHCAQRPGSGDPSDCRGEAEELLRFVMVVLIFLCLFVF